MNHQDDTMRYLNACMDRFIVDARRHGCTDANVDGFLDAFMNHERHAQRLALLRTLRAILVRKRETAYVRGLLDECIADALQAGYRNQYFTRPS